MQIGDRAAAIATAILALRRIRSEEFPADLFGEPVWDLLLELFVADAKGERLTGRDVSQRANIAPTVLSRWLIHLSKHGFIVGDGDGNLGDELTLSASAMDSLERTMVRAGAFQTALG